MKPTPEELKEMLNRDPYILGVYDALQWIVNAAGRPDLTEYEEYEE